LLQAQALSYVYPFPKVKKKSNHRWYGQTYEPLVHTSERGMENHQQRQIQSFIGYCTIKERSLPFLVVYFPIHCDFSDKNNLTKQASALSLKRFHPINRSVLVISAASLIPVGAVCSLSEQGHSRMICIKLTQSLSGRIFGCSW